MEAWLKEYKLEHLAVALKENGFTDPCDWANVKSLRQFEHLLKLLPINFMDSCKLEAAWRQFNKLDEVDSDSENQDTNKGKNNDTNKRKPIEETPSLHSKQIVPPETDNTNTNSSTRTKTQTKGRIMTQTNANLLKKHHPCTQSK
eukprot:595615_1